MTFTGQTADGRTVSYTDGKRYYWFFSFLLALVTPAAVELLMSPRARGDADSVV